MHVPQPYWLSRCHHQLGRLPVRLGEVGLRNQVHLGAVPMENMDLNIHPWQQRLEAGPRHPTTPHALVKRAGATD